MNKLFKFNQRARMVDENNHNYSFGVIIKKTDSNFSFDLVDNKGELIELINLNEWKIYSIWTKPYFSREKIFFEYSDPTGSKHILESGGRTLPENDDVSTIDFIASELLGMLLRHFHRISCFESISWLKKKEEELKKENRLSDPLEFNHQIYSIF